MKLCFLRMNISNSILLLRLHLAHHLYYLLLLLHHLVLLSLLLHRIL